MSEWRAVETAHRAVATTSSPANRPDEILIREKKLEPGLAELREATKIEDALKYDEPPGWLIPVRHSLGATLLQNGASPRPSRFTAKT